MQNRQQKSRTACSALHSKPQSRAAAAPYRTRLLAVAGTGHGAAGRRSRAITTSGRRIGAGAFTGADLHLPATIRSAAPQQSARGRGAGPNGGRLRLAAEDLRTALLEDARSEYAKLEEAVTDLGGEAQMRNIERMVLMPVIDQKWREHLYEMDYLKEGIGLRAMAQRDPLVEYQKEGGDMFNAMKEAIKEETVRQLFLMRKQFVKQDEEANA